MPSVRLVSTHGRFSLTQPNASLSMSFSYSRFGATGGGAEYGRIRITDFANHSA
jgi:hypothetical protein